jgi:hypothetical protein
MKCGRSYSTTARLPSCATSFCLQYVCLCDSQACDGKERDHAGMFCHCQALRMLDGKVANDYSGFTYDSRHTLEPEEFIYVYS